MANGPAGPWIADVSEHCPTEPHRLTPGCRRRAGVVVQRKLARKAAVGMTQSDPPPPARWTSDRDEARFAEVDERRATASSPQAVRDSIEGDSLAQRAEIERHAPRAQSHT